MASKTLIMLAQATNSPVEDLVKVSQEYPFALTPFLARRIQEGTYALAAARQFTPDMRELTSPEHFDIDPTGEKENHPEATILQTYDNRLVLMLTFQCLVYCRFCFRKAFVGHPEYTLSEEQIERGIAYIAAHPEIEDVVLSGGDPLALPNHRLLPILRKLTALPHLKVIRIDSRALNTAPQRLDDELVEFMKADGRFWYHAHLNHPDDIDHPEVIAGVKKLLAAQVPVMNQCVILAGVNDDPQIMAKLMKLCYYNKVLPYNLYIFDKVKGAAHFDVPLPKVIEICEALSHLPGPAQPIIIYVDKKSVKRRAIYDEALDIRAFFKKRSEDLQIEIE